MDNLERDLLAWADEAAEIALRFYRRTGDLQFKQGREAVTEADRQIEIMLRRRIGEAYPQDAVLGEEFGGQVTSEPGRRLWLLDPIDGTLNFALGLPMFCTSLAVMSGEEILAACVHQPVSGDSFTAVRGQGARLNGQAMTVSGRSPLAEAVIATHFKKSGRFMQDADLLRAITLAPLKCRRVGAIALEMAWVACGGYDGLVGGFSGSIHLWDVAAGLLLVQEAGGMISDHLGGSYRAGGADLVVSNGLVHQEILAVIASHPQP